MNKIERVLRHDGIVAVLDMTATSASAQAAQSPAPMTPPASTPPTSMTAPTSMAPTPTATPATQGLATPPASPTPAMGAAPAVQAPVAAPAPAPAAPATPAAPAGVSWVGDDNWRPIVMEAVKLRQIANEPSVRVLVGEHAVLVSGDDRHVVGVVFIKGHPVVKSVVRMVRQLLRQPNPPPQGL